MKTFEGINTFLPKSILNLKIRLSTKAEAKTVGQRRNSTIHCIITNGRV